MHAVVAPLSLIVEGAEYERLNLAFAAMAKARVDSVVVTEHELLVFLRSRRLRLATDCLR